MARNKIFVMPANLRGGAVISPTPGSFSPSGFFVNRRIRPTKVDSLWRGWLGCGDMSRADSMISSVFS